MSIRMNIWTKIPKKKVKEPVQLRKKWRKVKKVRQPKLKDHPGLIEVEEEEVATKVLTEVEIEAVEAITKETMKVVSSTFREGLEEEDMKAEEAMSQEEVFKERKVVTKEKKVGTESNITPGISKMNLDTKGSNTESKTMNHNSRKIWQQVDLK